MFGKELRRARDRAGLTQQELAFKAGLHYTYISHLEHDKYSPTISVLFRLCDALNISPARLISRLDRNRKKR